MKKTEIKGNVKKTVEDIRKKYGEDSIMFLEDKPRLDLESLSTGSIALDSAIGIGGLPAGAIIEVYGPESSGKTTLALSCVAEAQRRGWNCAYIDAEHAMDPIYARNIGVDTKSLLISQPSCGEEALQIADDLVRSGDVRVIVVDSVAMLTPRAEIEGELEESKPAAISRMMSKAMRVLTPAVKKHNATVIFINQIRMLMMSSFMGGSPETTPGGKALKFAAMLRLDIRKIQTLKKGDNPIGSRVKVKIAKNKVGPPLRVAEFDIMYNEGISKESELLDYGEKFGVVSKVGTGYVYGDHKLGRGFDASRQFLKQNADISQEIRREVLTKMAEISS
jgi:recombination protein RecA